ncbi:hypothetical protein [Rickettsiella massiliensis]|uniref:hypothetical protein n=1 Tax=Rickettsiella massiliensis TaxID=676517 RepID=UPI0002F43C06|nr:hypothetical protein [Rickettsiella massiliensis]
MQASPLFSEFINTEGLPILLDHLEIRGIDQLKALAEQFIQQLKARQVPQQWPQQQMNQVNPLQEKLNLEKAKLATYIQQQHIDNAHKAIELSLNKASMDTDKVKLMAGLQTSHNENLVQLEKAHTERLVREIDLAIKNN